MILKQQGLEPDRGGASFEFSSDQSIGMRGPGPNLEETGLSGVSDTQPASGACGRGSAMRKGPRHCPTSGMIWRSR